MPPAGETHGYTPFFKATFVIRIYDLFQTVFCPCSLGSTNAELLAIVRLPGPELIRIGYSKNPVHPLGEDGLFFDLILP